MIRVIGPDTPSGLGEETASFLVDAATLGDALRAYEIAFSVSLAPYDGSWPSLPFDPSDPKWFVYRSTRPKWEEVAVDVHVERGSEWLCPRQNLAFALRAGDVVSIGPLVC